MMEELHAPEEHRPGGGETLPEAPATGIEGRLIFPEVTDISGPDPCWGMPGVEQFEALVLEGEGHNSLPQRVAAEALASFVREAELPGSPLLSFTDHVIEATSELEVVP